MANQIVGSADIMFVMLTNRVPLCEAPAFLPYSLARLTEQLFSLVPSSFLLARPPTHFPLYSHSLTRCHTDSSHILHHDGALFYPSLAVASSRFSAFHLTTFS